MSKSLDNSDFVTAESIFREYLKDRGLRYTPERRMLLREVLGNDEHFEAEQLLLNLRQQGKRVAKATVYRTLPLLINCGIIKKVQFGDNLARYEHAFGQGPHDHMVCQRCHRIIEFDSADVLRLRRILSAKHGFHPLMHRFQITGLCAECVEACPASERPAGALSKGRRRSRASGR